MGFRQSSKSHRITPTTLTTYTSGKIMGGVQTIADAALNQGAGVVLLSLGVFEVGTNKNALTVLIFDAPPSGTYADNAALSLSAADLAKLVTAVSIASGDYVDVGGVTVAQKELPPVVGRPTASSTMYALIVAAGSITLGSTTALSLRLGVLQD